MLRSITGRVRQFACLAWIVLAGVGLAEAFEATSTALGDGTTAVTVTVEIDPSSVDIDADITAEEANAAEGSESAGEACASESCDEGVCEDAPCDKEACDTAGTSDAVADESDTVVRPTHKQVKVISAHTSDLPQRSLKTFCVTADGRVLAACGDGRSGDVRLFGPTGEYLTSWDLPFTPDAINVGSDDRVYAAGGGKLARFTLEGELVNEGRLPHADALLENQESLREEVVASHARQMESLVRYVDDMEKRIERLEEKIAEAKAAEEAKEAEESSDAEPADPEKTEFAAVFQAMAKLATGRSRPATADEAMLDAFKQQRDQFQDMIDRRGGAELTEEQIDQQVEASIAYKLKVASISEADGEVYVATGAEKGYGFCVWRTNRRFENGKKIVDSLSGCCGQMDVQACEGGVCIAENGRHHVRRLDRDGKPLARWGSRGREGLEGFGGCCNPMNVAFGEDGSVYTSESGTGRLKRFTPEGELIELVGKVDLVPGCKKVSIAVGPGGDRVYMLDITRDHIVMMERLDEGEQVAYYETKAAPASNEFFNKLLGVFNAE